MPNVTIVSHLSPAEWKRSWNDKVVSDTKENKQATREANCYWGHMEPFNEFSLTYHKADEIKGMSLGLYFNGKIEKDPQGCRITGTFNKVRGLNPFLIMGSVLCIMAMIGSAPSGNITTTLTAGVLLIILIYVFLSRPKKQQQKLVNKLKDISFDDSFHVVKKRQKKGEALLAQQLEDEDDNEHEDGQTEPEAEPEKTEEPEDDPVIAEQL